MATIAKIDASMPLLEEGASIRRKAIPKIVDKHIGSISPKFRWS